jgi:ribosomal protein S18 acetylase RimI-like enzyme
MVLCRALSEQDLPAVIHIDSKVTGHRHTAYYERKVTEALNESGIRVSMVAELEGQVVGFIMARVDYGEFDRTEPTAVLDSVAVHPGFGHHLVGSALLSTLLGNLTSLRLETIRTEVDAEHLDVLGFLLKNGFRQAQALAFSRASWTNSESHLFRHAAFRILQQFLRDSGKSGLGIIQSDGHTTMHCGSSSAPTHSVQRNGSMT